MPPASVIADRVVDDFAQRTTPAKFTKILRVDVAVDLMARIQDPGLIDQNTGSLCGPASLVFLTAQRDPIQYVQFVIDLYAQGKATIGGLVIEPSVDCRSYDPKADPFQANIPPTDWIALASIRDSENWLLHYWSHTNMLAGITMPAQLTRWLQQTGYTATLNDTSLLGKGILNARKASDLYDKGYKVCLFINAKMLDPSSSAMSTGQAPVFAPGMVCPRQIPNHWVVLTSPITFLNDRLEFEVFTWGNG